MMMMRKLLSTMTLGAAVFFSGALAANADQNNQLERDLIEPVHAITAPELDPVWPVIADTVKDPVWPNIADTLKDPVWPVIADTLKDPVWPVIAETVKDPVWPNIADTAKDPVWPIIQPY
jgi:hypothetical protein